MTATTDAAWPERLLPHHAALIADSAIAPGVARDRGYRSVEVRAELKRLGFGDAQCRVPALLVPVRDVSGEIATYQIRPDEPRVSDGKPIKYETPARSRMVLDVPAAARARLGNPSAPLWVTEGARKADSAVSFGLCCVALLGVWNWRGTNDDGGKTALPDWEQIALNGRDVYLVFDSDVATKPPVHAALARLKALLESRGASVLIVYLPADAGGAKVGLDDYLAAGHGVDDLLALASCELRGAPGFDGDDAPYAATPAGLVWRKPTENGAIVIPLANFVATIVGDVVEDDGAETRRVFDLEATVRGRTIRTGVPAAQFAGMGWVSDRLGAGAIVLPGFGTKDHARTAIQLLSGDVPERRVYTHTGWRRLDGGGWVYLHAGGGIGVDGPVAGVEVALPDAMDRFRLPDPPVDDERLAAVRGSLALIDALPHAVAVPLLAATYLAPLREALGDEVPDFVPWVHGPSGVFKTELIALAQGHFGAFARQNLPASFAATANAVERLAFAAKDA
ncbi:MAG: DUF3854 domain-containing protein, partial [Chloroflexota bacterium]|nr:DUF3854 domain-containing protein [Chloroflexota bacterium]